MQERTALDGTFADGEVVFQFVGITDIEGGGHYQYLKRQNWCKEKGGN